jgi:energy-converting hydrogenase Eha subunit C
MILHSSNMKKLILFSFLLILTQQIFAHAGMYDRFMDFKVSLDWICFVVLITHIVLTILIRKPLLKCCRTFDRTIDWLYNYPMVRYAIIVLLWGFVISPLLGWLASWLFLFGGIVYLLFIIISVAFIAKRVDTFYSKESLTIVIILTIQQVVGYIFYLGVYDTSWFRYFAHHNDTEGYVMYPGIIPMEDIWVAGLLCMVISTILLCTKSIIIKMISKLISLYR